MVNEIKLRRFAEISNNKVRAVYFFEELPPYPNPEDYIDVTDKPEVEYGWKYDYETGEFSEPDPIVIPEPDPIITSYDVLEKLKTVEEALATDNLMVLESIVDSYEKNNSNQLNNLEVSTLVFEEMMMAKENFDNVRMAIEAAVATFESVKEILNDTTLLNSIVKNINDLVDTIQKQGVKNYDNIVRLSDEVRYLYQEYQKTTKQVEIIVKDVVTIKSQLVDIQTATKEIATSVGEVESLKSDVSEMKGMLKSILGILKPEESTEETPVEETEESTEETPVEETEESTEETPVEETEEPTEETPAEETEEPTKETPVDETEEPTEETPVDETEEPTEETPVEEKTE